VPRRPHAHFKQSLFLLVVVGLSLLLLLHHWPFGLYRLKPSAVRAFIRKSLPAPSVTGRSGKSTGPRTPEGLERSRRANWKHGHFSREAKAERSRVRAAMLTVRYLRD
jgi:hypothetical protein